MARLHNPTAQTAQSPGANSPPCATLQGTVIGLVGAIRRPFGSDGPNFPLFLQRVEEVMQSRHGTTDFVRMHMRQSSAHSTGRLGEEAAVWKSLKERSGAAILGIGT